MKLLSYSIITLSLMLGSLCASASARLIDVTASDGKTVQISFEELRKGYIENILPTENRIQFGNKIETGDGSFILQNISTLMADRNYYLNVEHNDTFKLCEILGYTKTLGAMVRDTTQPVITAKVSDKKLVYKVVRNDSKGSSASKDMIEVVDSLTCR